MKLQMRYWARAPEPGSLQEAVALAIDTYEEMRQYEYVYALAAIHSLTVSGNNKGGEALIKIMTALKDKFFGAVETEDKITETERHDVERVLGNSFAVISGQKLREAASKNVNRPDVATVFNKTPEGEFFE